MATHQARALAALRAIDRLIGHCIDDVESGEEDLDWVVNAVSGIKSYATEALEALSDWEDE